MLTKTNRDFITCVFPRFPPVSCFSFKFLLVLFTFIVITLVLLHVSQLQSVQNVQGKFNLLLVNLCLFLTTIAQVYLEDGDVEYKKNKFLNAERFYTKGIDVNYKDVSHAAQGEFTRLIVFRLSLFKFTSAQNINSHFVCHTFL